MNKGFENKIYQYEVVPPAGVWEKITSELDQSELGAAYIRKLKYFKTAPPPEAWSKIASLLYGSSFIHDYATRLETLAITPPLTAWNKINAALDMQEDKPATPVIRPWFRYAAAAAVLALIAWAGSRFVNNRSEQDLVTKQSPLSSLISTSIVSILPVKTTAVPDQEDIIDTEEARDNAALEASKKTFAKLDASPSKKIKNAAAFYFSADNEPSLSRGMPEFEPEEIEDVNINSRYIVLMTPEGNIIRMSKKLSDLVCCVSGEDEEQDCVDQMKKWREKIANTRSGHSPGNFVELLNLVCSLEDNQP